MNGTAGRLKLAMLLMAIVIAGCIHGAAPPSPSQKEQLDPANFSVTLEVPKGPIRANVSVEVHLRVVNVSKTTQTILVWTCSKDKNWKSDNASVEIPITTCFSNFRRKVELDPGKAHEETLEMSVSPGKRRDEFFRVGFTSSDSKRTYWSNEAVIHFEGVETKAQP